MFLFFDIEICLRFWSIRDKALAECLKCFNIDVEIKMKHIIYSRESRNENIESYVVQYTIKPLMTKFFSIEPLMTTSI